MSAVETLKLPEYNQTGVDFRLAMPRPKVRGPVIDAHNHLLAARHAPVWFETAKRYGMDLFWTMGPLEEMVVVQRQYPGKFHFIAVPNWRLPTMDYDDWMRRLEAFYNMGSRIIKFHMAPGTMAHRNVSFETPEIRKIMSEAKARGMILMSHVGDPELWYRGKYAADPSKYGTRDQHYALWESVLEEHRDWPWLGAHLGGNPEDLGRLQHFLDKFPNLYLDNSATRWMVREVCSRRDQAREFIIRNQDRILYGSDQVSEDTRGFDFLASRWWCHRRMWETAHIGRSPILDPDLPADAQPLLRGLALPDEVLQKIYHDNAVRLLKRAGVDFPASL